MRYLTIREILKIHKEIIINTGGIDGLRDFNALDSAVSQPMMTFEKRELYTDLASKASALCYSLILNHPFVDGNKRVGHAAMEIFLILNGYEIDASTKEQEDIILSIAAGNLDRKVFTEWIKENIKRAI
jgi:death-on-curing protein